MVSCVLHGRRETGSTAPSSGHDGQSGHVTKQTLSRHVGLRELKEKVAILSRLPQHRHDSCRGQIEPFHFNSHQDSDVTGGSLPGPFPAKLPPWQDLETVELKPRFATAVSRNDKMRRPTGGGCHDLKLKHLFARRV